MLEVSVFHLLVSLPHRIHPTSTVHKQLTSYTFLSLTGNTLIFFLYKATAVFYPKLRRNFSYLLSSCLFCQLISVYLSFVSTMLLSVIKLSTFIADCFSFLFDKFPPVCTYFLSPIIAPKIQLTNQLRYYHASGPNIFRSINQPKIFLLQLHFAPTSIIICTTPKYSLLGSMQYQYFPTQNIPYWDLSSINPKYSLLRF